MLIVGAQRSVACRARLVEGYRVIITIGSGMLAAAEANIVVLGNARTAVDHCRSSAEAEHESNEKDKRLQKKVSLGGSAPRGQFVKVRKMK